MELGIFALIFWVIGALIGLGLTIFWIWMLIEAATKEPDQGNDKIVWIIIVAILGWIGAAIYFFVRRPKRITQYGS
jgi:hypothetical protein